MDRRIVVWFGVHLESGESLIGTSEAVANARDFIGNAEIEEGGVKRTSTSLRAQLGSRTQEQRENSN